MTKQTDDLIDRIVGVTTALRGSKVQLSPVNPTGAAPSDVPPPARPEVAPEDYEHAKKLAAELKSLAENLEAEISRESKVPEHGGLGEPKSKSKI